MNEDHVSEPVPPHVAATLLALANLIDERISARGVGHGSSVARAAAWLGAEPADVLVTERDLAPTTARLVARELDRDIGEHRPAALYGSDGDAQPTWQQVDFPGQVETIPREIGIPFAAGTIAPCDVFVELAEHEYANKGVLRVLARRHEAEAARLYLNGLLERARGENDPFRRRILDVTSTHAGIVLREGTLRHLDRTQLLLDDVVWRAIDVNVHRLFERRLVLREVGLRASRGVLLAGPPGTGKTALTRVVATELAGKITALFATGQTVAHHVDALYEEARHLAPSLVVIEDLDLIVGHRHGNGGGSALHDFLVALDGALTQADGIVTLATTNDPGAIDPAAIRACRFDQIITVDAPDAQLRRAILEQLLRPFDLSDVPAELVHATDGATGADLTELVRLALLTSADGHVTGSHLLATAADGRWRPATVGGTYL